MKKWIAVTMLAIVTGVMLSVMWAYGPRDHGPVHTGLVSALIGFGIAMLIFETPAESSERSTIKSASVALFIFVPFLLLRLGWIQW